MVTPDVIVVKPAAGSVRVNVLSKFILVIAPRELLSLSTVTPEPTAPKPVRPDALPIKFVAVITPVTLTLLATSNVVPASTDPALRSTPSMPIASVLPSFANSLALDIAHSEFLVIY